MTNERLLELLSFEESVKSVEIKSQQELHGNATFIIADLDCGKDGIFTIPIIHYEGEDWVFTPNDWQGRVPETPEEIDSIDWYANALGKEGIILNGLPCLGFM